MDDDKRIRLQSLGIGLGNCDDIRSEPEPPELAIDRQLRGDGVGTVRQDDENVKIAVRAGVATGGRSEEDYATGRHGVNDALDEVLEGVGSVTDSRSNHGKGHCTEQ